MKPMGTNDALYGATAKGNFLSLNGLTAAERPTVQRLVVEKRIPTSRPAADCTLLLLDDEGVVFCADQQRLFALNTTATLIWMGFEDGLDGEALASRLAVVADIDLSIAEREVERITQQWASLGLLAGTEAARPPFARPFQDETESLPAAPAPLEAHSKYQYRLLDSSITIAYATADIESRVHPSIIHLATAANPDKETDCITISAFEKGHLVALNGKSEAYCGELSSLAPVVQAVLTQHSLRQLDYRFQLHAGVVACQGKALLLTGSSGSGKSCLTARLAAGKWRYLSDESAPILHRQMHVRPVPLPMTIKVGGWALLDQYYSEISRLSIHHREDGKTVRYLPPAPEQMAEDRPDGYPVCWIVFPKLSRDGSPRLQPLSSVAALDRIFSALLSFPGRLETQNLEEMLSWISRIEAYELTYSSLDEAASLIDALTDQTTTN